MKNLLENLGGVQDDSDWDLIEVSERDDASSSSEIGVVEENMSQAFFEVLRATGLSFEDSGDLARVALAVHRNRQYNGATGMIRINGGTNRPTSNRLAPSQEGDTYGSDVFIERFSGNIPRLYSEPQEDHEQ